MGQWGGGAEQEQGAKMAKLEGDMRKVEDRLGGELGDLRVAVGDLRVAVGKWKGTVEVVGEVRGETAPKEVGGGLLVGLRWSF